MSAHVSLNLLKEMGKRAFYHFFATSFINSIIQGAQMLDSNYHMTLKLLKNRILA